MKLLNELLLLERPAYVHVNKSLSVLSDLIKDEFGDDVNDIPIYNKCLIAQVIYSLHARTSLTVHKLVEIFLKKYIHSSDSELGVQRIRGMSPQDVFDIYNGVKVAIQGKRYRMDLDFHVYDKTSEIANAIKKGHPVIVPYSIESRFDSGVESHDEEGKYNSMHVDAPEGNIGDEDYRHCLLAIGVDDETQEFILRDTRSKYLHKGYVKVPFKAFDNYIKTTFSYDVELTEV